MNCSSLSNEDELILNIKGTWEILQGGVATFGENKYVNASNGLHIIVDSIELYGTFEEYDKCIIITDLYYSNKELYNDNIYDELWKCNVNWVSKDSIFIDNFPLYESQKILLIK